MLYLKMPLGGLALTQHCIMTALAVARAAVERPEWKLGLCRQQSGLVTARLIIKS